MSETRISFRIDFARFDPYGLIRHKRHRELRPRKVEIHSNGDVCIIWPTNDYGLYDYTYRPDDYRLLELKGPDHEPKTSV